MQRNSGQGKRQTPLTLSAGGLDGSLPQIFVPKSGYSVSAFRSHACLIPLIVRSVERTKNGFPGLGVRKDFTKGKSIRIIHFFISIIMYQDYVSEKDTAFAREFEYFVNGRMYSAEATGKEMANAHRYLQQEMFKVCLAFVGQLAKDYRTGRYDQRNEWATRLAAEAYSHLVREGLVYDPEYKNSVITFNQEKVCAG